MSKTCSQRDVHVSLLTKVQRPRTPHRQNCTHGRHPIQRSHCPTVDLHLQFVGLDPREPKQLAKSFGNLELTETVLDVIRRHPQLLSLKTRRPRALTFLVVASNAGCPVFRQRSSANGRISCERRKYPPASGIPDLVSSQWGVGSPSSATH